MPTIDEAGRRNGVILSVLDQAPISEGMTGAEALKNSVDLARLCDDLGFRRYWVAEHHATPMLACASPEALIGPIASLTSRIKVGSGGVMLPHYSPLKVAETFSMFAGLFPDRIDLGLGRAPGSDPKTAYALQRDRRQAAPDDFPEQLVELIAYLEDRLPPDHPFRELAKLPGLPHVPEVHLLGSSPQSGIWAGQLGLPYVFADFINPQGAAIAARYRDEFTPSERLAEAAHHRGGLGARGGNRCGSGAALRQSSHVDASVSQRHADQGSAGRDGAALSCRRSGGRAPAQPSAASHCRLAGEGEAGDRGCRRGVWRGGGDGCDHHARARSPPPFV